MSRPLNSSLVAASFALLAIASACKNQKESFSDAKIVGGQQTLLHPEVRHFMVDSQAGRVCTGVAVSPNTALMAAHCVNENTLDKGVLDVSEDVLSIPASERESKKIYTWKGLKGVKDMNSVYAAHDVAVVVFKNDNAFRSVASLATNGPTSADVSMVGYGAVDFSGVSQAGSRINPIKRLGHNRIVGIWRDLMLVQANLNEVGPQNALAASGDSGGPLYDSSKRLIGIAAAMQLLTPKTQATAAPEFAGEKYAIAGVKALALNYFDAYQFAPVKLNADGFTYPDVQGATIGLNFFVDLNSNVSKMLMGYAVAQGLAKIPGISPVANITPEEEQFAKDGANEKLGILIPMCGGGGGGNGGGGNRNNNAGGTTGDNFGSFGGAGAGAGGAGAEGAANNYGNIGNGAAGFGAGATTPNYGTAPNYGTPGAGGVNPNLGGNQFGGPNAGAGIGGAGGSAAGATAYANTCANAGCHGAGTHEPSRLGKAAIIAQINNPSGQMASVVVNAADKQPMIDFINSVVQ